MCVLAYLGGERRLGRRTRVSFYNSSLRAAMEVWQRDGRWCCVSTPREVEGGYTTAEATCSELLNRRKRKRPENASG